MKLVLTALFPLMVFGSAAFAQIEKSYTSDDPLATTPWYEQINAEEKKADMQFIMHMRPHHAGALSMSGDYLNDSEIRSARMKHLARAIMHNQTFEIGVLDTIEDHLNTINPQPDQTLWVNSATGALAQHQRFVFAAIPSLIAPEDTVSARDVIFAKAMIVHHEGAVDMCKTYISNPHADNNYLEKMCRDIVVGQTQEIKLMHDIIADYPDDADTIKITPKMIHGMGHMLHGKNVNAEYRKSQEAHGYLK